MARTKQTARRSRGHESDHESEDYSEDISVESDVDSEGEEDTGAPTPKRKSKDNKPEDAAKLVKVLEGAGGVVPINKNSLGESQASKLGYPSKLVSKWYHHKCEYNSCPERWAEYDNVNDEAASLARRNAAIPIVHRHEFVKKHWVTKSFTVQDAAMRQVLDVVLAKYQDLDLELTNYTFEPPFMPLVHRWEKLKSHYVDLAAGPVKNGAAALLAFLAPIIASSVLSLAQTEATGKVSFENIWQIFPPSSIVKTKFYGVDTVCRVVKYKKREADRCNPAGWVIDMEYVDWNGETSGWTTTTLTIWEYEGYKKVTGLPVFPISFAPDQEKIRAEMITRGRKWEGLRGYHFEIAQGTKILLETEKPEQRPVRRPFSDDKLSTNTRTGVWQGVRRCIRILPQLQHRQAHSPPRRRRIPHDGGERRRSRPHRGPRS
jgi:hypothetical protein